MALPAPETDDTKGLIHLAMQGDARAVQTLLSRHRDRLKRMIAVYLDARVAPRVDPSDVLQDALAQAARRLPEYKEENSGGFYPWLRRIARDRIVDVHRRHIYSGKRSVDRERSPESWFSQTSAARLADQLAASTTSPTQQAIRNERREQLIEALNRIPDSYRELLMMRYVEQIPAVEIATLLSTTESAIKSKLWRALQHMNRLLRDPTGDQK